MMDTAQQSYQSQIDADNTTNRRIAQEAYLKQQEQEAYLKFALSEAELNRAASHEATIRLQDDSLDPRYYSGLGEVASTAVSAESQETIMGGSPEYIAQAARNLALVRAETLERDAA